MLIKLGCCHFSRHGSNLISSNHVENDVEGETVAREDIAPDTPSIAMATVTSSSTVYGPFWPVAMFDSCLMWTQRKLRVNTFWGESPLLHEFDSPHCPILVHTRSQHTCTYQGDNPGRPLLDWLAILEAVRAWISVSPVLPGCWVPGTVIPGHSRGP